MPSDPRRTAAVWLLPAAAKVARRASRHADLWRFGEKESAAFVFLPFIAVFNHRRDPGGFYCFKRSSGDLL